MESNQNTDKSLQKNHLTLLGQQSAILNLLEIQEEKCNQQKDPK